MEVIKGKRVMIRKLKIEDVFGMLKWGAHTDPLYFDYNFPKLKDEEVKEWFKIKSQSKNKKCFGIFNEEERIIGYLSIKNIIKFTKSSTLGIVLDPKYMNKGYGTEAIKIFLEYYFYRLKMKTMHLDVAKFNKRAINCYIKCGFTKIGESKQKLQIQASNFEDIRYKTDKQYFYFDRKKKKVYSYLYKMKISKASYEINRQSNTNNK